MGALLLIEIDYCASTTGYNRRRHLDLGGSRRRERTSRLDLCPSGSAEKSGNKQGRRNWVGNLRRRSSQPKTYFPAGPAAHTGRAGADGSPCQSVFPLCQMTPCSTPPARRDHPARRPDASSIPSGASAPGASSIKSRDYHWVLAFIVVAGPGLPLVPAAAVVPDDVVEPIGPPVKSLVHRKHHSALPGIPGGRFKVRIMSVSRHNESQEMTVQSLAAYTSMWPFQLPALPHAAAGVVRGAQDGHVDVAFLQLSMSHSPCARCPPRPASEACG